MFAKLNKIGELTKILSVKSETSDAIMHFTSVHLNPLTFGFAY